ncbi:hypothetical protein GKQ77_17590 [Streptomyces sp. BG9H]|uniref:Uncharacterized protein n=1 Tax=Streptomyces anatolicus TaxID=2675858 RepID=A0ABS6YS24_9ACTN|nr:hypothetical protein [Streptomyces anatolicus]MBW5423357.1 hypothetical protein [Streptomyces anatolicus]
MNRKKASKASATLFAGMLKVRSLGAPHALSLVALAAECVTESTRNVRKFVDVLPEMENPAGPHVLMLYYKHKPEIRDIRKSWTEAANSLGSHFPDVEVAWRDWVAAYGDMTRLDPGASQEDAQRILGELMAAKGRLIRSLSNIVLLICLLES